MNETSKEIIDKIKKEEIKMKPKWQFILRTFSIIGLAIIFFVIALYLSSFILFSFRPFPLFPLIFLMISIALFEYLLKEFKIVYRKPVIYTLFFIILSLFIMGLFLNVAHFHERIEKRNFPGIRRIYSHPKENTRRPIFEIKLRGGL